MIYYKSKKDNNSLYNKEIVVPIKLKILPLIIVHLN